MITKRDLAVGLIAVSGTLCALAAVNAAKPIIGESVYDWTTMKVTKTAIGETRSIVKGPTATLYLQYNGIQSQRLSLNTK